jgi:hypothetical protein
MVIVTKSAKSDNNHDDGHIVPFTNSLDAYDFTAELAERIDKESWLKACGECDNIHDKLDRFNDLSEYVIKVFYHFNTKSNTLGDPPPKKVQEYKTEVANIPFADIND